MPFLDLSPLSLSLSLKKQQTGYILPQPKTATSADCRIDTKKKDPSANVQLNSLVQSGKITRENCVKLVRFDMQGDPSGNNPRFEYHFGVWSLDGRVCPFNAEQMKRLIRAEFASRGTDKPNQTPNKWIIDKKNMLDPESFHVIKFEGRAFNVPMPITSTVSYESYVKDRKRAEKKQQTSHKQMKLNMMGKVKAKPETTPSAAKASPKRKAPADETQVPQAAAKKPKTVTNTPPPAKKNEPKATPKTAPTIRDFIIKHAKPGGDPHVFTILKDSKKAWLCTISAKEVDIMEE